MRIIEATELKEALRQAPTGPVVVNVGFGYAVFDDVEEFKAWKRQKEEQKCASATTAPSTADQ